MSVNLTGEEAQILASILHGIRSNCEKELQGQEIAPGMALPKPDETRAHYLASCVHVCNKVLANMLNNPEPNGTAQPPPPGAGLIS